MLHCNAGWMVDIKTYDSSNSVDDVALLIKKSIDREKLFKLIENRYADFAWYGELSLYTIRTQFGELEIEYR